MCILYKDLFIFTASNNNKQMKKTVLTLLLSSPFWLFSQSIKDFKVNNPEASKAVMPTKAIEAQGPIGSVSAKSANVPKNKKTVNYNFIEIGTTYYDLQTNSSPGRRVMLNADGSVSAVWTTSPNVTSGYPDRGSGYNYSDGSNFLPSRGQKLESNGRSGWPNIMLLDDGTEGVLSHESNTGGFLFSKNSSKGSTAFTTGAAILDDVSELNVDRVPIWGRSVATNGKIHVISNYWSNVAGNVPVVVRNGVSSPTSYSRINQADGSIEVSHILLPGYDSTLYANGGGDSYAMDARGDVIAILIGGLGDPVSLWKSTDNGQNWTYTDVDNMPYKGVRRNAEMIISGDTVFTNDGSLDVMVDASGKVHAFYGRGRIVGGISDAGDSTFFFFPAQTAMMHWAEGDAAPAICGGMIDFDGDGTLTISSESFSSLDANSNLTGTLSSATRTGSTSLVTMPSASVDANGNLFVVYSAPTELDLHFLNANFRDILVSYSKDGGATWEGPQNITQARQLEDNFPCVAKASNDYLHLIWQQDLTPGTNLQNHSISAGTHPAEENKMMYAAIPISDILNDVIGQNTASSAKEPKKAEVFVVSQNQPNPFTETSDVIIYLREGGALSLTVTDILGNVINQGDLGLLGAGNHTISIDAKGLTSGVYFYTLSTKDHSVTKKMQVN
jgi:hypothetical protein